MNPGYPDFAGPKGILDGVATEKLGMKADGSAAYLIVFRYPDGRSVEDLRRLGEHVELWERRVRKLGVKCVAFVVPDDIGVEVVPNADAEAP